LPSKLKDSPLRLAFNSTFSAISTCKYLKLDVVVAMGYTTTTINFILLYVLVELGSSRRGEKIAPTTTSNLTLPEGSYAPKD
jgi:hypothetical protein